MGKNLTFQTGILALAKSVDLFNFIILGMILSRVLTMEDYGTYRQVWLIYNIFLPVFSLGVSTSVNYFIPRMEREKQKTFVLQIFVFMFFMGLLLAMLLFTGARNFSQMFNNPNLINIVKIFSLIPLLVLPTSYYLNLYICLKKTVSGSIILVTASLVKTSVVLVSVYCHPNLDTVFKSLVFYYIFEFLCLSFLIMKPYRGIKAHLHNANTREWLKFTFPLSLSSLVGSFTRQMDKLIISAAFSPQQFAVYSNGAMEIPITRVLNMAATSVIMPELSALYKNGETRKMRQLWHNSINNVSLVVLPLMVLLLVFARETMVFLYSVKYLESVDVFRIFLFIMPVRVTTFGAVLLAAGLSHIIMIYSIITIFLITLLNLLFINWFGIWGASLATVVSIYVLAGMQLRKICTVLACKFTEVFPWRSQLRILLIALLAVIIPALIRPHIVSTILNLIINGVIFYTIFIFLAVKNQVVTPEQLSKVKRQIKKLFNKS